MNNYQSMLGMTLLLSFAGCQSYVTPKRGASIALLNANTTNQNSSMSMASLSSPEPKASFPANMAVARIQETGYRSHTCMGYGRGAYSVITVRDIETEEDFQRVADLPQLDQVANINRLLIPSHLESDKELRQAAERLHADMLLIYTIDTAFYEHDSSTPLSLITLGLSPTVKLRVVTTISGIILDSETGYLYGAIESTHKHRQTASRLSSADLCDALRLNVERQAFDTFLDDLEDSWRGIVQDYSAKSALQPRVSMNTSK